MRDPRRLDEGEATPFERQLLDAAQRQSPGAALKARMQEGLGLAGATVPVLVVAKSLALGWKFGVAVALVAVGAAVTIPMALRDNPRAMPSPTANALPEVLSPAVLQAKDPARAGVAVAGAADMDGSLSEEIRLLDRARGAMQAGAPRRALAELQSYGERYPRGAFSPEAIVLRVEALHTVGDSQAAKSLGRQFLAQYPKSPLADRVATIVQR